MGFLKYTLIIIALLLAPICGYSADYDDIYLAETAAGESGADCANALDIDFFNTSGNWDTDYADDNKIGPGDVVHLCGTISTAMVVTVSMQSGTETHPITIKFEENAKLSNAVFGPHASPAWADSGAIGITGIDYITIDGNVNGIIENTANGSGLANENSSNGIYLGTGADHIVIKNLIIQNIYQNDGAAYTLNVNGQSTAGIYAVGNRTGLSIHDNVIDGARVSIYVNFSSSIIDDIDIYNNKLADHCWGINVAGGNTVNDTATNVKIHHNEIYDFDNWAYPGVYDPVDVYHKDGIILYTYPGALNTYAPKVYNNYIHGDMTDHSTNAAIFCTYAAIDGNTTVAPTECEIYNNLIVNNGTDNYAYGINIFKYVGHSTIYNNTLIGAENTITGVAISVISPGTATIKNNIISTWKMGITCGYSDIADTITDSDNNIFYDLRGGGGTMWYINDASTSEECSARGGYYSGGCWYTLATWRDALGENTRDENSVWGDPGLTAAYKLQASSSVTAREGGEDLSGTFTTDYDGATRTVPWSIGADEYILGAVGLSSMGSGAITITPGAGGAVSITPY